MSTSPDRQAAIDKYFDDFLVGGSSDESLDEMIEALDEVIYRALLEKLGYSNSSSEQKSLVRRKMNEFMMKMDFNAPSIVHAEKMLHSIGMADFKKASQYLEQLYIQRSAAISEIQREHAKKPRKNDPFTEILVRILDQKSDISAEEVIERLESGVYSTVIVECDAEEICYALPDGREKWVSKSNIPSRLSRLRIKNNFPFALAGYRKNASFNTPSAVI